MSRPDSVHFLLAGIALLACLARFVGLEISPPGFFYDEATGAAHSMCYQETGRDLFGERTLFSRVDASSIQSMPFLVGSAAWTQVFGRDVAGFRSFIAFVSVLTVVGVGMLAQTLTHNRRLALWALALAACLPWSFQFSRISWDAPLGVLFLIWGLVFCYLRPERDRPQALDWVSWGLAGILLVLASYTYPPLRLQTLVMLVLLPLLPWRARAVLLGIFALGNLQVLLAYLNPEFAARAQILAITSDHPRNPFREAVPMELFRIFVSQMGDHLSWSFLLGPGDANLRHSIQTHGVLDWLSFGGLLFGTAGAAATLLRRAGNDAQTLRFCLLCLLGILAGLVPAALTWEGIPHALRSLGAWPFFVLLAAHGLEKGLFTRGARLLACAVMLILFGSFLNSYFRYYPQIAGRWFDAGVAEHYLSTGELPRSYETVARAYYLMQVRSVSCENARAQLGIVVPWTEATPL